MLEVSLPSTELFVLSSHHSRAGFFYFLFFALLSFIIQPERWGLPQWLNIMTCEPIKQLIRNGNEADDDEGEAVINTPPPIQTDVKNPAAVY